MAGAPEVCSGHSVTACVGSGVGWWREGRDASEEGGVLVMTEKLT